MYVHTQGTSFRAKCGWWGCLAALGCRVGESVRVCVRTYHTHTALLLPRYCLLSPETQRHCLGTLQVTSHRLNTNAPPKQIMTEFERMGNHCTSWGWGPCWLLLQDDGVWNSFRLSMAGKGSQRLGSQHAPASPRSSGWFRFTSMLVV